MSSSSQHCPKGEGSVVFAAHSNIATIHKSVGAKEALQLRPLHNGDPVLNYCPECKAPYFRFTNVHRVSMLSTECTVLRCSHARDLRLHITRV